MSVLIKAPLSRVSNIHFVGVGGSGMAGIAEVLLGEGYQVSGSDLSQNPATARLSALGVTVFLGHSASHVEKADVLVVSSAINAENVEVITARQLGIPVITRAEMLAEIMRFRYSIAVAGTHGKTTTTSLLATIFSEAGLDPTFVIGGRLNSVGSHARLGSGQHLIAEADESDASFLHLLPMMSVVTNIDADHLSAYQDSFENLQDAFCEFLHKLPFYGLAVLCLDDDVVRSLIRRLERPIKTYGFSVDADVRATDLTQASITQTFTVNIAKTGSAFEVTLNMPGRHNVLNALAAITIALEHNITPIMISNALKKFQGVDRRFTVYNEVSLAGKTLTVVDDYGHHPEELKATFQACTSTYHNKRLIWVFQPHRYSRTRDCFHAFCEVLQKADCLVLLDVYAAGEAVIPGADGQSLYHALGGDDNSAVHFAATLGSAYSQLERLAQEGDVVLLQGAGTIKQLVDRLCMEAPVS